MDKSKLDRTLSGQMNEYVLMSMQKELCKRYCFQREELPTH